MVSFWSHEKLYIINSRGYQFYMRLEMSRGAESLVDQCGPHTAVVLCCCVLSHVQFVNTVGIYCKNHLGLEQAIGHNVFQNGVVSERPITCHTSFASGTLAR